MIPLRTILENERKKLKVPWSTLEQDYILSWILWGIYSRDPLRESLVFKGGTALKKIYFGDYRFSQDLDFTALTSQDFFDDISKACRHAQENMSKTIPDPVIECTRYEEKEPHPGAQEAFTIRAKLPWHRTPQVRVMVEITKDEPILLDPVWLPVQQTYQGELTCQALVYTLEEIIAEKLRAILQNIKKYHERGWGRSRVRDYYDIWCILNKYDKNLDLKLIPEVLDKKCQVRSVPYDRSEDFFDPIILKRVKTDWAQWLAPLVSNLPDCDVVLGDLRLFTKRLLGETQKNLSVHDKR